MGELFGQHRENLMALTLWRRILEMILAILEAFSEVLSIDLEELTVRHRQDYQTLSVVKVTNTDHTAIWLSHEISDEPFFDTLIENKPTIILNIWRWQAYQREKVGLQHLMTVADGDIFRDEGYLRVYSYHSAASDVAFAH